MTLEKPTIFQKRIMVVSYVNQLTRARGFMKNLRVELGVEDAFIQERCKQLERKGLMKKVTKGYKLTEKGRSSLKVVLIGGVFNILHPGHLYTFNKAKSLGDVLVVSVARDQTVRKMRGSDPEVNETERRELVQAMKPVDLALLGSTTDIFETAERVRPQIIALGYDQKHEEEKIIAEAKRRGIDVEVVRLDSPMPHLKSSDIIRRIMRAR